MAREEIVEKLQNFFNNHSPFTEECHVIYALVEIRKVLDRESNRQYPILRFYCNWVVHTDKDSTREMEVIMNEIYKDIEEQIANPALLGKKTKIIGFMYMEDLQIEMKNFLDEYHLSAPIDEKGWWVEFVKCLVSILEDQPINNPAKNIRKFAFLPAADGCVRGRIDFIKKVGKYDHYRFGNVY